MAKKPNKQEPKTAVRLVDQYFNEYPKAYPAKADRHVLLVVSLVLLLGFTGLFWSIPFPYLQFMGRYNGFINWASFFMAVAGYFYYRLSPVLCYLVILLLFVFAYIITVLQGWQSSGGPSLTIISDAEIVLGAIGFYVINLRNQRTTQWEALNLLFITPAWYLAKVLKKIGARY